MIPKGEISNYVPVPTMVSYISISVDVEISIPSVLGLSPGAISFICVIFTCLQSVSEIWFLGLSNEVIPFISRLLHPSKCNCYNKKRTFRYELLVAEFEVNIIENNYMYSQ